MSSNIQIPLSFLSVHRHRTPLSLTSSAPRRLVITNGGGPRTFPGGVSKWQWKRMQAKKAKQLLKARLSREREVYEMRRRAEIKAAVAELERPWESVSFDRAPRLFSLSADDQVKVLADRFQKPGGFDMWSERDGPQLFSTVDGIPSARFFPKGVVHSTKPYGKIDENLDDVETNGYITSDRFSDTFSSEGQVNANSWIGSDVNGNERRSDSKIRNKPYKKSGRNSNMIEKLSFPSSLKDVSGNVERNEYKNSDRVSESFSGERQSKYNKWIKNPNDGKEIIGSNDKFRKQPYLGKSSNVAERLSLLSSVSGVENDIGRNRHKNLDRFRGTISSEGQISASKWTKNTTDSNEKIGRNGKFRNKPSGKFGRSTNGAENLSFPRSFSEFEDPVKRKAYQESDRFSSGVGRDSTMKNNRYSRNSTDRKEMSNDGKFRNKESTRRVRVENSNTSNESRGLSSKLYDMNLHDDGSYEFGLYN